MSTTTPAAPRPLPWAAIVFVSLALLLPLPFLFFDAFIPLARMVLLTSVTIAVAVTEGAGGPVRMIVGMFVAHSVVYALVLAFAARMTAVGLRRLPASAALVLVTAALVAGLAWAVLTRPYITPFGVTPRSNLLEALS
jgi:hypothetical protein